MRTFLSLITLIIYLFAGNSLVHGFCLEKNINTYGHEMNTNMDGCCQSEGQTDEECIQTCLGKKDTTTSVSLIEEIDNTDIHYTNKIILSKGNTNYFSPPLVSTQNSDIPHWTETYISIIKKIE